VHTLSLPDDLAPVLGALADVDEPNGGVYLVGGAVRDILLGEPNFDVDVVVEGDAIAVARALAAAVGGRVRAHPQFGTAVVLYGDDGRIDVVTARSETYHAPAALPTVEPGSIEEDLHRRDFTINAMAVSLSGDEAGKLVDPFDGRRDLEAGRIRILHDRSFIDDPTRILRAIRYEDRFGFRMDEETEALARSCIETGHVGDLSGARLREELVALLEEGDVSHAIPRLAELGAEKEIHPGAPATGDPSLAGRAQGAPQGRDPDRGGGPRGARAREAARRRLAHPCGDRRSRGAAGAGRAALRARARWAARAA